MTSMCFAVLVLLSDKTCQFLWRQFCWVGLVIVHMLS